MKVAPAETDARLAVNLLDAEQLNRIASVCLDKMTDDDVLELVEDWAECDQTRIDDLETLAENLQDA